MLTPETGAIIANANTYGTVEGLRAYAVARGVELPAEDAECEVLLVQAMDYLEAQECEWNGHRVSADQELSWPRKCVRINGFPLDEDAIPKLLISAQYQLAIEAASLDLMPTGDGREVKMEKLDVIETEYFQSGVGSAAQPSFPKVDALLAPLKGVNSGYGFGLEMVHA